MRIPLSKKTKRKIKGWLKTLQLRYIRWRYAFDRDDFITLLHQLGLKQDDIVLVHCAFNNFHGFTGKATDVIEALQEIVGPQGALLMPTMPFEGTAIDYVRDGNILDIKRTPSRMGMLTELFRRMPGVVRSIHPTHATAAWGAKAEVITKDHTTCTTPCGRQSPYGKLLDYDGRILLLGTGIEVLTFFHAVEEIVEPMMPFSPFTEETFQLSTRVRPDFLIETTTRLFEPQVSRRRNVQILATELKKHGHWKQANIGPLEVVLLEARNILETVQSLAEKGIYCYDNK